MKKEGPRNLYVGSLHYNITEPMLKKIFEPFGYVEKMTIQRDENGLSKGYGFIEVRGKRRVIVLILKRVPIVLSFVILKLLKEQSKILMVLNWLGVLSKSIM